MQVNDNNYFQVQAWMVSKLGLKTVERDVFAIIYGYSQDKESDFHGSLSYMSELTGYSKNSICTALKSLTEKDFIIKSEQVINNIKCCRYTISFDTIQAACTGIQATCTNNINNNKNKNVLSKDNTSEPEFDFGNTEKPKTQNLYTKCMNLIDDYIAKNNLNPCMKTTLKEYLDVCMEMRCIRGANQWKGMLNTLEKISNETGVARGLIIQQSITHGWKTFYPVNNFQPKNKCVDNVQSPKDNNEYHPVLDENGNPIVF